MMFLCLKVKNNPAEAGLHALTALCTSADAGGIFAGGRAVEVFVYNIDVGSIAERMSLRNVDDTDNGGRVTLVGGNKLASAAQGNCAVHVAMRGGHVVNGVIVGVEFVAVHIILAGVGGQHAGYAAYRAGVEPIVRCAAGDDVAVDGTVGNLVYLGHHRGP